MDITIQPHTFWGNVRIPASKSHTIRQLLIAGFADGASKINFPLDSLDARSCLSICKNLGVQVEETLTKSGQIESWTVHGINGADGLKQPINNPLLDVGNSGTTLFLALAMASLGSTPLSFTGDRQIERRSALPLLQALSALGITVSSNTHGCVPITVCGPWKGGKCSLSCPTSQYLSAILLAAPLAEKGVITEIDVPLLNEKPYIEMTLSYLHSQGVKLTHTEEFSNFVIEGGHRYKPLNNAVPADFSSAAFPACAALVSKGKVTLQGLDPADFQGDKEFFNIIASMGAGVKWGKKETNGKPEYEVSVWYKGDLHGGAFDLNDTPDLLPVVSIVAAFSSGETRLYNVAHARIKETDRIACMAAELGKIGVTCRELPDGLIITGSTPHGGKIDGGDDHRIVMAFAAAACGASAPLTIQTAEAADVTYPGFLDLLKLN
ncbi:3-phosphoshikimate 1-carboxyvinyltransferase [Spirochaetia bacterium]|nr:3-phosphoshikimate 1-carboxyvinyltransferase [Spirochaetia bacterium]